jgi:hypothetical protein
MGGALPAVERLLMVGPLPTLYSSWRPAAIGKPSKREVLRLEAVTTGRFSELRTHSCVA